MEMHPYGEQKLDQNCPPSGTTGLIIRQWYTREEQYGSPSWFDKLLGIEKQQRYFIFRHISGSYDYTNRHTGESMCGGYTAIMGYWHYATESERDQKFKELSEREQYGIPNE